MSHSRRFLSLTLVLLLMSAISSFSQEIRLTQAAYEENLLDKALACIVSGKDGQDDMINPVDRLSAKRITTVATLFADAIQQGKNELNALTEIEKSFCATEAALAQFKETEIIKEGASEAKAEQRLLADANAKYPALTLDEIHEIAARLYPLYKSGEKLTVNFKNSPRTTMKVSGIYRGTKAGYVVIGKQSIRLEDMRGVEGNDGADGEIAKFSRTENEAYRQELIDAYLKQSVIKRNKFIEENREAYIAAQYAADASANEQNGWTEFDGQWFTPQALVQEVANQLGQKRRNENQAAQAKIISQIIADAQAQLAVSNRSARLAFAAPVAQTIAQTDSSTAKNVENDAAMEPGDNDAANGTAATGIAADITRDTSADYQTKEIDTTVTAHPLNKWLYIAVSILVVLVIAIVIYKYSNRESELDVSSFFVGQGKLQEEFWAEADSKPDTFKYVAYLFPTLEQAQKALGQLSFINIGEHGIIQARRQDLKVGAYDHQGRAVAFIGGETLNYARWREATMTWPELPGAAYFKVSSEPIVKLEIPDMGSSSETIQSLGCEDLKGDNGEITRVFKFSCESRDEAITFLEKFTISEEGIIVQIETADGIFSKDINGIFTA